MKKILALVTFLLLLLVVTACGSTDFPELISGTQEPSAVDSIPKEPSKDDLIAKIKNTSSNQIEPVISNNFYLFDTVKSRSEIANIYATKQFEIPELVSVITDVVSPEQESDYKDGQQILIYPDHFVTFKESEEDSNTVLIEVATDRFVRNNYSGNFLAGYFAIRILDDVLGADDWVKKRRTSCITGDCYGGYTNPGKLTTKRGMSSVRGGGPSAGK